MNSDSSEWDFDSDEDDVDDVVDVDGTAVDAVGRDDSDADDDNAGDDADIDSIFVVCIAGNDDDGDEPITGKLTICLTRSNSASPSFKHCWQRTHYWHIR